MKRLPVLCGVLLLAGCATEDHRVKTVDGVTHYGLNDQPQKAVTAEGGLMRGLQETGGMPTGQFTGRERTLDQVGQYPTPPREADPRELTHD